MTRQLIIGLVILAVLTMIVSLTTIVGFFIGDLQMVLTSAKILSLTSLVLMSVFFKSVYEEMYGEENVKEVRMELKSKEDIEEFRRQMEEHLQDYIKEIAEEEEIKEDKDV
jgi:hypothetical protein